MSPFHFPFPKSQNHGQQILWMTSASSPTFPRWISILGTENIVRDLGFTPWHRTHLFARLPPAASNVVDCGNVCRFRYFDTSPGSDKRTKLNCINIVRGNERVLCTGCDCHHGARARRSGGEGGGQSEEVLLKMEPRVDITKAGNSRRGQRG